MVGKDRDAVTTPQQKWGTCQLQHQPGASEYPHASALRGLSA